MPGVMEAVETAAVPRRKSLPAALEAYKFQPGHAPLAGAGRPKGAKSWTTVLGEASPKLAKKYVQQAQRGAIPLLLDSRKVFLPIDSDAPPSASVTLLAALVQLDASRLAPPPQPVVAQQAEDSSKRVT